jgi:hypothetical protein
VNVARPGAPAPAIASSKIDWRRRVVDSIACMALAKGTTFLHDEEYVVVTYGREVWERVLAALSPADL